MSKLFRIINILIFSFYNRRVNHFRHNIIEKEILISFNKKTNSVSELDTTNMYLKKLRILILNNLINFLRNETAMEIFFVTNRLYIFKEYFKIKKYFNSKIINERATGNPIPLLVNLKTSGNRVHHLYHYYIYQTKIHQNISSFDLIFEFGGGYGSQCSLAYDLGFKGTYIIFDFWEMNLLQKYYLFCEEFNINPEINTIKKNKINFLNDSFLIKNFFQNNNLVNYKKKLFISCWAISECEINVREQFNFVYHEFNHFLIAYQEFFANIKNDEYFKKMLKSNNENLLQIQQKINNENHFYLLK